ncbi:MAG: hypothetical protein JWO38_3308 [Gemmataceae bacterium]|nr:hypothetical protein [Gemmataceae bacterium]
MSRPPGTDRSARPVVGLKKKTRSRSESMNSPSGVNPQVPVHQSWGVGGRENRRTSFPARTSQTYAASPFLTHPRNRPSGEKVRMRGLAKTLPWSPVGNSWSIRQVAASYTRTGVP